MQEAINTFFFAAMPVGELRTALPAGIIMYGLDWKLAFLLSIIGNLIPVALLLLFLGPVSKWLSFRSKACNGFFSWIFKRTRKRTGSKIEKYGSLALVSFVAIPLPFTGAWTGAMAAFLFGIPFKKAFPLISLGVAIAGIIILLLTQIGIIWLI